VLVPKRERSAQALLTAAQRPHLAFAGVESAPKTLHAIPQIIEPGFTGHIGLVERPDSGGLDLTDLDLAGPSGLGEPTRQRLDASVRIGQGRRQPIVLPGHPGQGVRLARLREWSRIRSLGSRGLIGLEALDGGLDRPPEGMTAPGPTPPVPPHREDHDQSRCRHGEQRNLHHGAHIGIVPGSFTSIAISVPSGRSTTQF
jgi:hypothetical protein